MQFVVRRARGLLAGLLVAAGALSVTPSASAAAMPGYNGRITFTRAPETGPWIDSNGVYTVKPDGSGLKQLTFGAGAISAYNRDGSKIAYNTRDGIWAMNSEGGLQHALVPGARTVLRNAWSPDGSLFLSGRNGGDGIDVIHADGSGTETILLGAPTEPWYPSWSPDGTKVVYWDGDNRSITTVNVDGTGRQAVFVTPYGNVGWSSMTPDGTKFVWAQTGYDFATGSTPWRIFVANLDGSDVHAIGGEDNWQPVVSPDGQWVAYAHPATTTEPDPGIWVMRIDGTDSRQITHGYDLFPDWQPLASPPNVAPYANFTAKNTQPLTVYGNGSAAYDEDGTIVKYEWRWGDNTAVTTKQSALHRYAQAGSYVVQLTVVDDDGARTIKKTRVQVN